VQLITANALNFEIPEDLTVAYFYNPFTDDVFREVIDKIVRSIDRNPRRVTIVYAHPRMADAIVATGRFDHVHTSRGPWRSPRRSDRWVCVYRSRPW
jgi:hypothetical protein